MENKELTVYVSIGVVILAALLWLTKRELPSMRRYLRIRRM